jgi:HSP20 family protein
MHMSNSIPLAAHLDQSFDPGFGPDLPVQAATGSSEPPKIRIDIEDAGSLYLIQAEIPGATREQIAVRIDGSRVSVQAEIKNHPAGENHGRLLHRERQYGLAFRAFALPRAIDAAGATARFENGVLYLSLPTPSSSAGQLLEIR